jgi:hypothetical protein
VGVGEAQAASIPVINASAKTIETNFLIDIFLSPFVESIEVESWDTLRVMGSLLNLGGTSFAKTW